MSWNMGISRSWVVMAVTLLGSASGILKNGTALAAGEVVYPAMNRQPPSRRPVLRSPGEVPPTLPASVTPGGVGEGVGFFLQGLAVVGAHADQAGGFQLVGAGGADDADLIRIYVITYSTVAEVVDLQKVRKVTLLGLFDAGGVDGIEQIDLGRQSGGVTPAPAYCC